MKKILLVLICSFFFVSGSFAYEASQDQKDSYYGKTKNVYYTLHTQGWIDENEYETLREQAWEYIYKANSQPKKIYDTALTYKKDITKKVDYFNDTLGVKFIYRAYLHLRDEYQTISLSRGEQTYFILNFWEGFEANDVYQIATDIRNSRKSDISNRKDYWYSTVTKLTKVSLGGVDAYMHVQKFPNAGFSTFNYHLYHNGYIVELTLDSRMKGYKEIIKDISFFSSQEDTPEDTYYSNDILGLKFIIPAPNKIITENNSSILVGYNDISYFSILTSKDKKRLGNGVYTSASNFQKSLKKDEKSSGGDLKFAVGGLSKSNFGGKDSYIVEQNFLNTGHTKWFHFVEHNGYFFQIETDSRFGDTMSLSDSFTFY